MTTRVEDVTGDVAAQPTPRLGARLDSLPLAAAIALVFTSNTCIMVMELVASRILAPAIGQSLYTWTSIIGIILAGISLGNWLSGQLADHYASRRTVGWIFILAGLAALSVIPLGAWVAANGAATGLPLVARIVVFTILVYFLPSVALGLISPMVIKLTLRSLTNTGSVVGRIYAFSTLGNIVGNFLTGFYLIAWFPVHTIMLAMAGVLILAGLLVGRERLLERGGFAVTEPMAAVSGPREVSTISPAESLPVMLAVAIVFIANVSIMSLEMVASRVMAPVLGVSLYTWTSIFGVVLAGMAVGNTIGGLIADRYASRRSAAWVFIAAGLATLIIIPLGHYVVLQGVPPQWTLFGSTFQAPLVWRIVVYTAAIFFLPCVALGMLTPMVVKLTLNNLDNTGSVVGKIYASATFGSIIGTFLTGFWLISTFGTRAIILGVGVALVIIAFLVGRTRVLRPVDAVVMAALVGVPLLWVNGQMREKNAADVWQLFNAFPTYRCQLETNYFCIRWYDQKIGTPEENVTVLVLDHLIHSYNSTENNLSLHYAYERAYSEIMAGVPVEGPKRVLALGGGGYTYPRYMETKYPDSYNHVVEIDPGVSYVALNHMGVDPNTKIKTTNYDARQYLQASSGDKYNYILGDAFNDYSVPFHLTTREFTQLVYDHLTDDGMYLANVIDTNTAGFLSAYARTVNQVFPHVYIIPNIPNWKANTRSTFVIVGSKRPLEQYKATLGPNAQWMPQAEYDQLLRDTPQLILTDNYVPTDNLLAPVFAVSGF